MQSDTALRFAGTIVERVLLGAGVRPLESRFPYDDAELRAVRDQLRRATSYAFDDALALFIDRSADLASLPKRLTSAGLRVVERVAATRTVLNACARALVEQDEERQTRKRYLERAWREKDARSERMAYVVLDLFPFPLPPPRDRQVR